MKIQCDVCRKKEACVFCSADEAALCDVCDQRVHHANKLASKHSRFSLLHPCSSQYPLCDICQEKRALLFCQQDRAILCRDCDIPLHTTNEYTQKHNRFLLTGIKLSAMLSDRQNRKMNDKIMSNESESCDPVPDFKSTEKPTSVSSQDLPYSSTAASIVTNSTVNSSTNHMINGGLTSNISEYLVDVLPGWHFEDLLVDAPFGYSNKGGNNHDFEVNEDVLSFFDIEHDKEMTSSAQSENFWVPQASPAAAAAAASSNFFGQPSQFQPNNTGGLVLVHGTKQQQQETSVTNLKFNSKYLKDDAFTVPQITSFVRSNKRTRPFW